MVSLNNVSIRSKIVASFLLVLLITLAIGGLAMNRLSAVNSASSIIRDNYLPSLSNLGRIIEEFELYRIRHAQMVLSIGNDPEGKWKKSADDTLERFYKLRKAFDPYIDAGEERERWNEIDSLMAEYKDLVPSLVELIAQGDRVKAANFFQSDMRTQYTDMRKLLMEELAYNEKNGKQHADESEAIYKTTKMVLAGALLSALVLSCLAGVLLISSVSRPVTRMTGSMERLAEGDLEIDVEGTERADEIGKLARAMAVFKENALRNKAMEAEKQAAQEARERRAKKVEELNATFDRTASHALDVLASAATELRSTAGSMSSSASMASSQAATVAAASEEASANVQAVASATEELTASISEIARQVSQSSSIAAQAVNEADQTNKTVADLAQTAQKIGDVVGLINDIASQTNLLALNATIEAARAGEAGKGFAVVASEVKGLANQTAKATEDITAQVGAMQAAMQSAVSAIDKIGKTIRTMNDISSSIATAVEQQGAATKEITRNVSEAAQGTAQVSRNITGVNQAAEETGGAANEVLSASEDLSKQAETLRASVHGYLADIRSA